MLDGLKSRKFAVVLSGGGARGAYEAGVMSYIRSQMPERVRHTPFSIYCGASVGAVNACLLASHHHRPLFQGEALRRAWETLKPDEVYRRNFSALSSFALRSLKGISRNFLHRSSSTTLPQSRFNGLVDTSPFAEYLKQYIQWDDLHRAVSSGSARAVAVTSTNMTTGQVALFLERNSHTEYRGVFPIQETVLDWRHVMASSAIPILFPPVEIDGVYFADGGLRLNTPLAPAIHMGADRMLVIGMHHVSEHSMPVADASTLRAEAPTMGDTIGKVLNSIFVDKLEYDLKHMERINAIVSAGETLYGSQFLEKMNHELLAHYSKKGEIQHVVKQRHVLGIFPSRDVRMIFREAMRRASSSALTTFEKSLFRVLDVDSERGQEFLSYFLFLPEFIHDMVQLGMEDAHAKRDEVAEFFLG